MRRGKGLPVAIAGEDIDKHDRVVRFPSYCNNG